MSAKIPSRQASRKELVAALLVLALCCSFSTIVVGQLYDQFGQIIADQGQIIADQGQIIADQTQIGNDQGQIGFDLGQISAGGYLRRRREAPAAPATTGSEPPKTAAGQASGEVNSPFSAFGEQLRSQGEAAAKQLQTWGNQFAASVGSVVDQASPKRPTRQISYPPLPGESQQQPQQQQQQPQLQQPERTEQGGSNFLKYLSNLGQQAQQAQALQQLFASATGSANNNNNNNPNPLSASSNASSTGQSSIAQMMGQLSELIKSTQERNARLLDNSQRSLEASNQETVEAAKSAQGGIQSALSEMGQGLQKLAANNPNLVPDIKNLYQSVASKLSSASSSVAQSAGASQPQSVPAQS